MTEKQKTILKVFKKHSSKKNPIKLNEIVNILKKIDSFKKYSQRQFRIDIQDIRRNNIFEKYWVVSGNFGYYLTSNYKEILAWSERYESYIFDMFTTLKGLKKRSEFYNYKFDFVE